MQIKSLSWAVSDIKETLLDFDDRKANTLSQMTSLSGDSKGGGERIRGEDLDHI